MFGHSASSRYRDRANNVGVMLRTDSLLLRVIVFVAMSAIFFIFLKITERKVPHGLVPGSSYEQTTSDTARPALK
jgi:hypothetical protein